MTFARFIATGSGAIAVRLEIPGLAYEFVSDPGMVKTTDDGRERVLALPPMGEGIVIEDEVNIPEATLDALGQSITLYENDEEQVAKAFWWMPSLELYISATVEDDEDIPVLSSDGVNDYDVVHIGTEAIHVDTTDPTTIVVNQRGYWGTVAQKHWSNELDIGYSLLTNRPLKIRGRRARIFAYGDGDDLQGDGTQVWLGLVTSDPRCDDAGGAWRLQLSSIASVLKSKIGGELEQPQKPRGVYYSDGAALRVQIIETQTGGPTGPTSSVAEYFTGFYETQQDFCTALTAFLAAYATDNGLYSTYEAVADGARWTLRVVVGSNVTLVEVFLESEQDYRTRADRMLNTSGNRVETITAGDVIQPAWLTTSEDDRMVPRGFFGNSPNNDLWNPGGATFPIHRIYVGAQVTTDWSATVIEWGGLSGGSTTYAIADRDTSDDWIEPEPVPNADGSWSWDAPNFATRYGAYSLPSISPTRRIAVGTLQDFRDGLIAESAENANRGVAPFITDADLADWTLPVTQAENGRAWLTNRSWTFGKAVKTSDVLEAEWRLRAMYPVIESDGRIGTRVLELPSRTATAVTEIDDEIIGAGWSSVGRGNHTINRVLINRNYDALEDDWPKEHAHEIVDATSYAMDHEDRVLEIEPRSRAVGGDHVMTYEDAALAALPVIGLFGYPHAFVDVHVSWKLFHVLLGDTVSFSADHLPDFRQGVRPIEDVLGIVVKRRWALGEPHGTLRILLSFQNIGGYAPTAHIDSESFVSGNTWDLTVDHELYAPTDAAGVIERNTDTFFAVGDRIRVVKYDSETGDALEGNVTAVDTTTHVIRVALDGATWVPGSDAWELIFDYRDELTDDQKQYAFIANSTARVGGAAPFVYAP
jgi:hypothetical protein